MNELEILDKEYEKFISAHRKAIENENLNKPVKKKNSARAMQCGSEG